MEARANMERSRAAYVGPGEGRAVWVLGGQLLTYKVTAEQTGGAYSLFEVMSRLEEGGPPPHVQHREDESFYVLEGEYEFLVEGRTINAGAGSLIYIPKGNLHAHKNVGEGTGRMLVSQTPGGSHERFFEEIGEPVDGDGGPLVFEGQPDLGRIAEIAAEYGIEITPPTGRPRVEGRDGEDESAG